MRSISPSVADVVQTFSWLFGLNRYNMLQDGKKRKKVSIQMHDTLKTNCDEKTQEKKREKKTTTKNGVNGIRTHIHENRWLLVYIYSK